MQRRVNKSGVNAVCPICSARIAACDHEIVRWSLYATEWEDCALLGDMHALVAAVEEAVLGQQARGRLEGTSVLSARCAQLLGEAMNLTEVVSGHASVDVEVILSAVSALPGVVEESNGGEHNQDARVLWARDPEGVRESVRGWVHELKGGAGNGGQGQRRRYLGICVRIDPCGGGWMSKTNSPLTLMGVDGCRGGWVAGDLG